MSLFVSLLSLPCYSYCSSCHAYLIDFLMKTNWRRWFLSLECSSRDHIETKSYENKWTNEKTFGENDQSINRKFENGYQWWSRKSPNRFLKSFKFFRFLFLFFLSLYSFRFKSSLLLMCIERLCSFQEKHYKSILYIIQRQIYSSSSKEKRKKKTKFFSVYVLFAMVLVFCSSFFSFLLLQRLKIYVHFSFSCHSNKRIFDFIEKLL